MNYEERYIKHSKENSREPKILTQLIFNSADKELADNVVKMDLYDLTIDKLKEELEAKDNEIKKWQKEALQQYPTPEAYQTVCDLLETNKKEIAKLNNEKSLFREILNSVGMIGDIDGIEHIWDGCTKWVPLSVLLTNNKKENNEN